jgi:hypothetical protein
MKVFKIAVLSVLILVMGLGLAGVGFAKGKPTGAYQLCLESTTSVPGAPRARFNLLVAFPKPGAIANVSGKLILSHGTTNPPLVITFKVKGTYDTKAGTMALKGTGGGTDNAKYVCQAKIKLPQGQKKGPYVIEYNKVGAKKPSVTKGDAKVVPCVKGGANK